MKVLKGLAAAAALSAGLAILPGPAFAGHYDGGDVAAAGALGLIGGAILGGAMAAPPPPVYMAPPPPPVIYAPPRPVYVQPVVSGNPHVGWCASHHRSYNPYDNTWIDRYGRLRVCASPYGY